MKVGIMGTGYVGLVYGTVLAALGHRVICTDVDHGKIQTLKQGLVPIHEPGLETAVRQAMQTEMLLFSTDLEHMIRQSEVVLVTVGTPPQDDGRPNVDAVMNAAAMVGTSMNGDKTLVLKSTVPLGTTRQVEAAIRAILRERGVPYECHVAMNPEFLKEGAALHDAMHPNRIVIGASGEPARASLLRLYRDFADRSVPFLQTNPETAEMIKYASNAFLALKISFINEFSLLAEQVGANVAELAHGLGLDERIGPHFLKAGAGYGGSCFPKDNAAILAAAREHGQELLTVRASVEANERHKNRLVARIVSAFGPHGDMAGRTIGILGLSFKPGTDDVREAPSLHIIRRLLALGADIQAYCPHGMPQARRALGATNDRLRYAADAYECAANADAVVLVTEWPAFLALDLGRLQTAMAGNLLFDFRNLFAGRPDVRQLFDYRPIGL
ncbi:UDP-glucose dehydrogenase family protein [Paenibacillus cymbidii]|uniref:UDP-glucose dehydrogenase family protein n=1 Tax=Paenibacillus cymbidii TaxID=1639034 RepID=UPI00107FECAA|nr:UDP-glucose/GDP-mannose dehydrogenase family protein [Paenibacillus cymbidii]